MSIRTFSEWLTGTPASTSIRGHEWIIPSVQCMHIVAICIVIGSVLLLNLRLIGIMGRDELISTYVRRYVPWVALAVVVLFLTGVLLIVGEPGRNMENWVFWTKMKLLTAGIVITSLFLVPMIRDSGYTVPGSLLRWW